MISGFFSFISQNIKRNNKIFYSLLVVFCLAVTFGSIVAASSSKSPENGLSIYLSNFIRNISGSDINNLELFKKSILENLAYAVILCCFGLSLVGIPFIYIFVVIKGYALGFTCVSVISVTGNKGLLLLAVTILIKELIMLPALLFMASNGITYSMKLLGGILGRYIKKPGDLALKEYLVLLCLFVLIIALGSFSEAYISLPLLKIVTPMLI